MIRVVLPLRLVSEANARCHWSQKARRVKEHRQVTHMALAGAVAALPAHALRIQVLVTRIAPRKLDSHDNLRVAAKGVVDGIADALGIDDGDPRMTWSYQQEIRRKERGVQPYGVRIEIVTVEP